MKSVLLTRSIEGNKEIILEINKRLNNHYFNYIHCPLIEYHDLIVDPKILSDYSNIIITSKHAAKVISTLFDKYNSLNIDIFIKPKIWVVGESCLEILQPNRFLVQSVFPNINELMAHFPSKLYSQTIYLSSNEITINLPLEIKRQIIYRVEYVTQIPQIKLFKDGIDYILLYSRNSAKTLIKLLVQNDLLRLTDKSLVITISKKVADIIAPFIKNVIYPDDGYPNQILDLLIDDAKAKN